MNTMSISDFKEKSNIEIIQELMKINNGYVTSKLLSSLGIHRMYLKLMEERKMIEKMGNGIYMDVKVMEDLYYIFNLELPNTIYSHMTALYFHGLANKAPFNSYDVTVPNNYYNYKLKKHNVFYVNKDIYNLGLSTVLTPMGNKVRAYDKERCICDIFRSRNRIDAELLRFSIKEYLRSKDKDMTKLVMYAEKIGIKKELIDYMEIFYE